MSNIIPANFARIPAFLLFDVGKPMLALGPVHGDYTTLARELCAPLKARAEQPLVSNGGFLDTLDGTLVIAEDPDRAEGWSGCIERTQPRREEAGFRVTDYRVLIEIPNSAFADLLQTMQVGSSLTGLVLNFQNVDGPLEECPFDCPIPWDDSSYPAVTLTSFRLCWGSVE